MAKKTPPTPTSTATTRETRAERRGLPRRTHGFSLIEVLVVIGLMALVTGVFIPSFTSAFRVRGEGVARKLALQLGEARDRALLTDKLIRLKVDFDKQVLTLEEAPSQYLVPKAQDRPPSEREREELAKAEGSTFRLVTEIMKEPFPLPGGLKVIQIDSPRYKKPVTEGTAFVYFFNNGATDGATLYFETDEKVHQAITLHPVTGVSKLDDRAPGAQP